MSPRRSPPLWLLLALGLGAGCEGAIHYLPTRAPSATDGPAAAGDGPQVADARATPAADGPPATAQCNDGEAYFEGYCYAAVGMGEMTWEMALQGCDALGSQPASIHSEAENQLAFDLLYMWTSCAWIGLTRDSGGEDFTWTDGTPLDFTPWQSGAPNEETCGCIGGPYANANAQLRWRDVRCNQQLREIVCKRKP